MLIVARWLCYVNPLDVDTVLRANPELMTLFEKPTQMSVKEDA